jgi:DnaJ-class molecular chaperone
MGKKSDLRDEYDRKHGNAGWAPCKPCDAYGTVNGHKCSACGGIGFIPRSKQRTAADERKP